MYELAKIVINEQLKSIRGIKHIVIKNNIAYMFASISGISHCFAACLLDGTYIIGDDGYSDYFDFYIGVSRNANFPINLSLDDMLEEPEFEIPVNRLSPDDWADILAIDSEISNAMTLARSQIIINHTRMVKDITNQFQSEKRIVSRDALAIIKAIYSSKIEEAFGVHNTEDEEQYIVEVYPDFKSCGGVLIYTFLVGYTSGAMRAEDNISFILSYDLNTSKCLYSEDFPWVTQTNELWTCSVKPDCYTMPRWLRFTMQAVMNDVTVMMQERANDFNVRPIDQATTCGYIGLKTPVSITREFTDKLMAEILKNCPPSKGHNKTLAFRTVSLDNGITRLYIGSNVVADIAIEFSIILDVGFTPNVESLDTWDEIYYTDPVNDELLAKADLPYDKIGYTGYSGPNNLDVELKTGCKCLCDMIVQVSQDIITNVIRGR